MPKTVHIGARVILSQGVSRIERGKVVGKFPVWRRSGQNSPDAIKPGYNLSVNFAEVRLCEITPALSSSS